MPTAIVDLPFVVSVKGRSNAFTQNMELAAIILLSEAERKKRGLFGAAAKKISFISKLHYPLWAVPWEHGALILDGLGVFSSRIDLKTLPDVTVFTDDIERGATIRDWFLKALEKHRKTFAGFPQVTQLQVNALMMDKDLLSIVSDYVKETLSQKIKEDPTAALVPAKLDPQDAIEAAKQVLKVQKQIQSEVAGLDYAVNLLEETGKLHEQMILKEVESIRESFEVEVALLRPKVDKKVDQLLKERDGRVAKMNRVMDHELRAKERERERRERELQRLETDRANSVKKREAHKRRHDKIGETHWNHRIRADENKIEEVKSRIRALSEFIEKTRRQNESDVAKISYGYNVVIDREKSKIANVEFERDRAVEAKLKEVDAFRLMIDEIVAQIEGLVNQKREQGEELKGLAVPLQFDDVTLVCMPFYLTCFQNEGKNQFHIFPPFKITRSEGVVNALRKTLGGLRSTSRMKLFLQPRSKVLDSMLDFVLKEKMKSDKTFTEDLKQAATSCNVLVRQNFEEGLTRGVAELSAEGWITQKEKVALIKSFGLSRDI